MSECDARNEAFEINDQALQETARLCEHVSGIARVVGLQAQEAAAHARLADRGALLSTLADTRQLLTQMDALLREVGTLAMISATEDELDARR